MAIVFRNRWRSWLLFGVAALLAGLELAMTVRAEDWPEFRGPTGQGHSSARGLPVHWSAQESVAWKQALPGLGWSSPACVDGRIYLTTAVPLTTDENSELALRTICLAANTGATLWETDLFRQPADAPRIHGKNSHASPSPMVAGSRIFVHFGHQGTACLDRSGKVIWKNSELTYSPVHGNGGSPILYREKLIFSCDGGENPFLAALDAKTGQIVWKISRASEAVKKFAFSTPLLIESGGKPQVISPGSDSVGAFDPETGREIWRVRYTGYSVIPRPVFGCGLIFMSTGYDAPEVLAIRPDGEGDVTDTHLVWRSKKGAPHTPSLLLHEDDLYMVSDNGIATCLDALTGTQHWQQRLGGNYSASPLLADGNLYFQNETGIATVLKASKKFEQVAINDLGDRTLASYGVVDQDLLIRTAGHLFRIHNSGSR